jgi:hypothetical protein
MLTLLASLALLLLGLGLLLHHGYAHMDDDEATSLAKREGLRTCCFFQPRDVQNHETWIVVCWTNALTLALVYASGG